MKSIINLALASALVVSLSGCIVVGPGGDWSDSDWRETQKDNRELIAKLELNTERATIISRMGAPDFSEAYSKDGSDYRVLYYRTQHKKSDGETTIDETTPLVFKDDKLVGWGEKSLENVK